MWALLLLIASLPKVTSLMAPGTALDRLSGGELFWFYFVGLFFHQFSSSTALFMFDASLFLFRNYTHFRAETTFAKVAFQIVHIKF